MITQGIASFIHLTVAAALALVLLPGLIAKPYAAEGPLMRGLGAASGGLAGWLLCGLLLGLVHSMELFNLLALAALIAILLRSRLVRSKRRQAEQEQRIEQTAAWLDSLDPDGKSSPTQLAVEGLARQSQTLGGLVKQLLYWENAAILAAVAMSVSLRLVPLVERVAPVGLGAHQELLGIAALTANLGIFQGGLYPIGVSLLGGVFSTLFFLNPLDTMRLYGALALLLLLLTTLALTHELSENRRFSAYTVVTLALCSAIGLNIQPLSMQWAFALLPMGVLAMLRYARCGRGEDLAVLAANAFALTLFNPMVSVLLLLVISALALMQRGDKEGPSRTRSGTSWAVCVGATAVGLLPLLPALLERLPTLSNMWAAIPPPLWMIGKGWLSPNSVLTEAIALVLVALALWLPAHSSRARARRGLAMGLSAWVLVGTASPAYSGLNEAGHALGTIAPIAVPLILAVVLEARWRPTAVWVGVAVLGLIVAFPDLPQALARSDPQGAARTVLRIEQTHTSYTWTLISPVTQYSEVVGHGWHVELIDFLRQYPVSLAAKPHWLPKRQRSNAILTPRIYVLAPRAPAHSLAARAPLPTGNSAAVYAGAQGRIVDAHAAAWMLTYLKAHPRSSRMYYQGRDTWVLEIDQ